MSGIAFLTLCTIVLGFVIIVLLNILRRRLDQLEKKLDSLPIAAPQADTGERDLVLLPDADAVDAALTDVAYATPAYAAETAPADAADASTPIRDRRELVAAISAAVAEDIGWDISGVRILSLRALDGAAKPIPNRQELLAAVTAAIAEDLGTAAQGFRVLSFKALGHGIPPAQGGQGLYAIPDRQERLAAVTAAIAEDLGTEVRSLRVLSFTKC